MKISICMATYNGAKYVKKQLISILNQLSENDEIIIVDDCSSDNTIRIINSFKDNRITLIENKYNMGFIKTFERAIKYSSGDIIFLSDQDDIWVEGKVSIIKKYFQEENIDIVFHDAIVIDEKKNILFNSFTEMRKIFISPVMNFISNTFTGCCMAFKANIKDDILPIPSNAGYHDRWIVIIAGLTGAKIKFIPDKLIYYVRHNNNVSPLKRRNLLKILIDRMNLLISIIVHLYKVRS